MLATLSIKRKVILTVICLCLVSITIFVFFTYSYQMRQLRAELKDLAKNQGILFHTILDRAAEDLSRAQIGLHQLDSLLQPFATRNKEAVLATARPIFEVLRLKNGITHMYFIEPNGKVLLRVHKPEESGDVVRRATFLKARATQRHASGMELGLNFFSLRSVNPVSLKGRLIGYLEVAEEMDNVLREMKRINGTEVSLFLTRDYVSSQRTHVTGEQAGPFTILYPSQKEVALRLASRLQPEMKAALDKPNVLIVSDDGAQYAVGMGPIRDVAGTTAGILFSHRDVSPLFSTMWESVAAYVGIIILILLLSLFLLYLSLRKSLALFSMLKEHIASVTTTWDLSKELTIPAYDEIGELASEFNTMTDRLRLLTMELEQRITDKEQMLIHQSRMATMGEMIGCIAHQWRQPLNTLNLLIQELPVYYKQGALTEEHLAARTSLARELIVHMSQTVEDFRNFFSPGKEKTSFSMKDVVERSLKLMKVDFSEQHIEPVIMEEDHTRCEGYPNEYGQVILNILRNISDVFVEREVADPRLLIHIYKEKDRAVMTITDNAGGIPTEIIDKIFDPYFTTKGPEKGTGLGLYISKIIIEKNMGGRLTVRNTADGAEFRIETEPC